MTLEECVKSKYYKRSVSSENKLRYILISYGIYVKDIDIFHNFNNLFKGYIEKSYIPNIGNNEIELLYEHLKGEVKLVNFLYMFCNDHVQRLVNIIIWL